VYHEQRRSRRFNFQQLPGHPRAAYRDRLGAHEEPRELVAKNKTKPTEASVEHCLCFRRLSDLDKSVLEDLVVGSIAEVKRLYG
jgi:hypothetical protein